MVYCTAWSHGKSSTTYISILIKINTYFTSNFKLYGALQIIMLEGKWHIMFLCVYISLEIVIQDQRVYTSLYKCGCKKSCVVVEFGVELAFSYRNNSRICWWILGVCRWYWWRWHFCSYARAYYRIWSEICHSSFKMLVWSRRFSIS